MNTNSYIGEEQLNFSIGENEFNCMCKWSISIEEHMIVISVSEKNVILGNYCKLGCNGIFQPMYLYLNSKSEEKITLYSCLVNNINYVAQKISIIYNFMFVGSHVSDVFNSKCKTLNYTIESTPIPMVHYIPFRKEKVTIGNTDFEISMKLNDHTKVDVEINSLTEDIGFSQLTSFFYNIMDIIFLLLGFYPYTIHEQITLADNTEITLYHWDKNKFVKGNSESHWQNILVSSEKIYFASAFSAYYHKFNDNNIVIEVLTNAMFSSDLFCDLKLSLVLQCIEGYMTKWHNFNKFEKRIKREIVNDIQEGLEKKNYDLEDELWKSTLKSITNLLGGINKQSFSERIEAAFNMNDNTSMIVNYERAKNVYKDFIDKSKSVRNQFAHISNMENVFELDKVNIAVEKYILLLRVIILSDLGVDIDKDKLQKKIKSIDESYN